MNLENIVRPEKIENSVSIVTKIIMQSFKTTRQIDDKPPLSSRQDFFIALLKHR